MVVPRQTVGFKATFTNTGTYPFAFGGLHFDSIRNGDISVTVNTKFYPKSDIISTTYNVSDTTDKIAYRRRGRYRQYQMSGAVLGQSCRFGNWIEELKQSGRK